MRDAEGKLKRNLIGRWEVGEVELTSGTAVDLQIEGQWISGNIEFWHDDYYWVSRKEGVPVILHSGVNARCSNQRRYIND